MPHPRWHDSLFMRAARREPVERTPIWLMRQAGRYMPEYRQLRREVGFLDLCKNPKLCAEVMISAVEQLGVDAAILFSDLLLILEPMGIGLEFSAGDGPVLTPPIRAAADVDRLRELEDVGALGYVTDAVRATRAGLDEALPLVGFSGAPFTLAAYVIEGGGSRDFRHAKTLMHGDPGAWDAIMGRLARAITRYLNAQIAAGAQAVQLFDSWVGCLGTDDYCRYVLPYTRAVIEALQPPGGTDSLPIGVPKAQEAPDAPLGSSCRCAAQIDKLSGPPGEAGPASTVPVINFATGNPALLPLLREAGGSVIGVDWRIRLDDAWQSIGPERAIQGNLDPTVLLSTPEVIRRRAAEVLAQAGGRPGHIFNLGHGVLPQTPVENVKALVGAVHEYSAPTSA
jgi:uroporphyrinogen decarboxylase